MGINNLAQVKIILEAVLMASAEPVPLNQLSKLFPEEMSKEALLKVLEDLHGDWQNRGVELVSVASGWRFQARAEYQTFIERLNPEKPPKYSRAVLETLAIIAYRQPVTRGEIEDVRGVAVSSSVLKTLEARGWVTAVGHREVPGRPALYATTKTFLDDLNLTTLDELPPLEMLGDAI